MGIVTILGALAVLALTACHPAKPRVGGATTEALVVTSENAEQTLNQLEMNLRELQMLDNDVVTNGDAIIAIYERNSAIVHAIKADTLALTPQQRARFRELLKAMH